MTTAYLLIFVQCFGGCAMDPVTVHASVDECRSIGRGLVKQFKTEGDADQRATAMWYYCQEVEGDAS